MIATIFNFINYNIYVHKSYKIKYNPISSGIK